MATLTKTEILDLGSPVGEVEPTDAGKAWRDAYFNAMLGNTNDPTLFGFFVTRIARTVTGATVAGNAHKAALPGPVLHVQATTATSAGPKAVIVTGTPGAGEVRIDTDLMDGRDTLTFAAADVVTVCAYRQQAMPQEMYDQLVADTVPPIESSP